MVKLKELVKKLQRFIRDVAAGVVAGIITYLICKLFD